MTQSEKMLIVWRQGNVYFVEPTTGDSHLFQGLKQVIESLVKEQTLRAVEGVKARNALPFLYDAPQNLLGDEAATCLALEEILQQQLQQSLLG